MWIDEIRCPQQRDHKTIHPQVETNEHALPHDTVLLHHTAQSKRRARSLYIVAGPTVELHGHGPDEQDRRDGELEVVRRRFLKPEILLFLDL